MNYTNQRKVTVIYSCDDDLSLYRKTQTFKLDYQGEMVIPQDFKVGKTIVALCAGDVDVINSVGDRLVAGY